MHEQSSLLNNRYQLDHEIARGGMAAVWQADDTALGRQVAVKLLHPQLATDPEFLERFRREARAAARLSHPNIVAIYDIGEDVAAGGTPYIVMELIDGPNLKDVIRQRAPLPAADIRRIGASVAEALAFAHQRGVVHRDVKPQNILLGSDGRPHLADFGIAQALANSGLTRAGTVMGSVHYLAPELLRGGVATPASDLYSLGAVLYEMATGRLPFTGETDAAVAMAHLQQLPVPPRQINPALPADLEQTILQALAKTPAQRFASADVLAQALAVPAPGDGRARLPGSQIASDGPNDTTVAIPQATVPLQTRRAATEAPPFNRPPRRSRTVAAPPSQRSGGRGLVALLAVVGALLVLLAAGVFAFSQLGQTGGAGQGSPTPTVNVSPTPLIAVPPSQTVAPATRTSTATPTRSPTATSAPSTSTPTTQPPTTTPTPTPAAAAATPTAASNLPTPVPAVAVPNVVGQSSDQAQQTLRAAGFQATVRTVNADAAQGAVVAQVPAAGAPQVPNGVVTISVASGNVAVPDVAGRLQVDATTLITQAGLRVQRVQQLKDPRVDAGSAIGTTPAAGTIVPRGSGVTLTVSSGRS